MRTIQDGQELSYEQLMARWGYCIDGETATIGFLLRILRQHFGHSQVFQRCCFGMSESDFRRLQRMARPRADHFVADVRQTAMACHISNFQNFCVAMEQARKLAEQENTEYPA